MLKQSMQRDIAISYVYALIDYMRDNQLLTKDILAKPAFASIDSIITAFERDELITIPLDDFTAMLDEVAVLTNNPAVGLEVGKSITAANLGVLGYVLLACPHLGAVLSRLERYARLVDRAYFMEISMENDHLKMVWPLMLHETYHAAYSEMGMATFVQYARNLTAKDMPIHSVTFCHQPLTDEKQYTDFFGGKVLFDQAEVSLKFDINYLNLPLRQPDDKLLAILEKQAKQALAQIPNQEQFLQQVHTVMLSLCREALPTLDEVANKLNMSARTLQRKLAEHSFTFQQLLEQTQQHLAGQYLKDEHLQLVEIAQLLGYSDQSAFTRAFKRWTGKTPKVYRSELLQQRG